MIDIFSEKVINEIHSGYPAFIIELRHNKTAGSAMDFECLSQYKGNILFEDIDYDEKDKTHK